MPSGAFLFLCRVDTSICCIIRQLVHLICEPLVCRNQ
nr:MAG TPA: hypothetical protein [Caudoviricetes sp.]